MPLITSEDHRHRSCLGKKGIDLATDVKMRLELSLSWFLQPSITLRGRMTSKNTQHSLITAINGHLVSIKG